MVVLTQAEGKLWYGASVRGDDGFENSYIAEVGRYVLRALMVSLSTNHSGAMWSPCSLRVTRKGLSA